MRADNFLLLGFSQSQDLRKGLVASEAQVFVYGHIRLPQERFKGILLPAKDGDVSEKTVSCSSRRLLRSHNGVSEPGRLPHSPIGLLAHLVFQFVGTTLSANGDGLATLPGRFRFHGEASGRQEVNSLLNARLKGGSDS